MTGRSGSFVIASAGMQVQEIDGVPCQPGTSHPLLRLLDPLSQCGDECASGAVPSLKELAHGNWVLTTRPASFEVQLANGVRLQYLADAAVRGERRSRIPLTHLLARHCSHPFLRIPIVHDLLDRLQRKGDEREINILLGVPRTGRGRPLESAQQLHKVSIMNALKEGGCTAVEAAREARKLVAANCTEEHLRNLHSQLGDIAKILQEGYFIPAGELRPFVWGAQPQRWTLFEAGAR